MLPVVNAGCVLKYTYGNHECHDNPPFYIEEREWTILGFLLRYAMSMFLVKFMKYQTKE